MRLLREAVVAIILGGEWDWKRLKGKPPMDMCILYENFIKHYEPTELSKN